jgi:hypothetical protein
MTASRATLPVRLGTSLKVGIGDGPRLAVPVFEQLEGKVEQTSQLEVLPTMTQSPLLSADSEMSSCRNSPGRVQSWCRAMIRPVRGGEPLRTASLFHHVISPSEKMPRLAQRFDETGHSWVWGAPDPRSQIAADSRRVEGSSTSKPPPAEETTGVQADGEPEFLGNSKRDANNPAHRRPSA